MKTSLNWLKQSVDFTDALVKKMGKDWPEIAGCDSEVRFWKQF